MYSQNDEEAYIIEYFKGVVGKFIDIGGFHPFRFSNTRKLYELGWNGVIVEPSPKCFLSFKEYQNESRIKLLNVAISDNNGTVLFYESNGDAISTTEVEHKTKWENGSKVVYNEIEVPTISMESFLSEHGSGVDFISIDTESTNFKLLLLIPGWFLQGVKMVCIEHDNKIDEIKSLLAGFTTLSINAENIILAK